ncbi:UDP-glucose 4-epimerase family protein [Marinobacterium stanieri]|uniref:Nucleoside-diphosphate-sugar epimerase n=1 Tax=Marinobacterium stanieri TaxID=49186 RepID=A0A1N6SC38_9GAMM|nr:SDR family oxidoreductase [Marinobacterium stanieri]SIQ38587.1 Nucleoside-diphosphate-sugar epimerase [Marinobacterium stanieri]
MNILLTGANGFIGCNAAIELSSKPFFRVFATVRRPVQLLVDDLIVMPSIGSDTDFFEALSGQHVVIHTAARAHITTHNSLDPLATFRTVNVDGTLNLARQAAKAGVKRFIFLSSIGVNGVSNKAPFTVNDRPNPSEPYAQSKWEAEQGLVHIAEQTDMEVVIIRPPLVYGANAPGNFGRLVRWVEKGIPLPLGAVHNQRTLVGLDNLVDLIRVCIDHPAAANQVIFAGDDEDVSTTQILRGIAEGMGKSSRLIPVPEPLLWAGASVLGKKAMAEKVLGSLQVDISETKRLLDWEPPYSFAEGMKRCFE